MAPKDLRDLPALPGQLELPDRLALLDSWGLVVLLEQVDYQVQWDPKVQTELKDLWASQDHRGLLVPRVTQEQLGRQEELVLRARRGCRVQLEKQGTQVSPEARGRLGQPVHLVRLVSRVPLAESELQDSLV